MFLFLQLKFIWFYSYFLCNVQISFCAFMFSPFIIP